jgi:hypothetical protein
MEMRRRERFQKIFQGVIEKEMSAADGVCKLYLLGSDHAVAKVGYICAAAAAEVGIESEVLQKTERELGIYDSQSSVPQPGAGEGGSMEADQGCAFTAKGI